MTDTLDIRSKSPYPSCALSKFAAHAFEFDGVPCASMEGLLQAFTVEDVAEQLRICSRAGAHAKNMGKREWRSSGLLWWKGQSYDRLSDDYQALLDRAYQALFDQSQDFRDALAASDRAKLTHVIGHDDPGKTILTNEEFLSRLESLRSSARLFSSSSTE